MEANMELIPILLLIAAGGVLTALYIHWHAILILSVVGCVCAVALWRAAGNGPPGTTGGFGAVFLGVIIAAYLIPVWVTVAVQLLL